MFLLEKCFVGNIQLLAYFAVGNITVTVLPGDEFLEGHFAVLGNLSPDVGQLIARKRDGRVEIASSVHVREDPVTRLTCRTGSRPGDRGFEGDRAQYVIDYVRVYGRR